ncbi:MAG: purine-nucleoside phosphorylase [Spirochaetales bacterium]|nr:purine-nucleoside phosphorylase [Candidatus Physcosoma equi]
MSVHISAPKGAIAECVLLPGDPLRAKHIAEKFFENPVCHNNTRGMLGYTGTWNGHRVSVQGTGMGMPSFSIYATELIDFYGCKKLVRVGTCGSNDPRLKLKDVFIAQSSNTDSGMNVDRFGSSFHFAPIPSFDLLRKAYEITVADGYHAYVGPCFSSDKFYDDRAEEKMATMKKLGIYAEEMESAELYTLGALKGVDTLALFTVSDNILTGERTTAEERQTTFDDMIEIALKTMFA